MEIIIGRKGTQRTPITDTTVSREHCKLTINADGTYTLENLSINGTFVNGNSIIRTVVTPDTILRLGANFSIAVRDLLPLQSANIKPRQAQQQNPLQQFAKPAVDPNQERYEMEFRKLKSVYEKLGLNFVIKPMGFKHTGLFPEQAANWDWFRELIEKAARPIKVLNLFAYTGGATVAAASAGASAGAASAAGAGASCTGAGSATGAAANWRPPAPSA